MHLVAPVIQGRADSKDAPTTHSAAFWSCVANDSRARPIFQARINEPFPFLGDAMHHDPGLETRHDALLTVEDAAAFLQVTVSWVYEHANPKAIDRLPAVKLGKYLRFDRRDLRAYIDAKRANSHRTGQR